MNTALGLVLTSIVVAATITCAGKLLNLLWLRPRKLEKLLRNQGLNGNPYRPFLGDAKDFASAMKEQKLRSIQLSDDILPHIFGYFHTIVTKYGPNSFLWLGPWPRLNIADPALIREILRSPDVYQKPLPEMGKILTGGLVVLEGEKWAKHRKIVNPAFHVDKLKNMVPSIVMSCSSMIQKWEAMVSGSGEIDVWPFLEDLTGDVISRTAFGSSHEEGTRIFQLQKEKLEIALSLVQLIVIPGWRFLPTKVSRRLRAITTEVQSLIRGIIEKRQKAIGRGEAVPADDLLGLLMESNSGFIQEHGNKKAGMNIEDVIEECKLFYFAGSETTSSLLVWTMLLLSIHPDWQTQAREEVNRVFGNSEPTFEGLNHLKTVTMILQEVLRLYPPLPLTARGPTETVTLGNLTIPKGVHMTLLLGQVHRDPEIWGEDAREFKPQRFSEGIPKSAKMKSAFIPFGSGPRACIGQHLAMIEAKVGIAMILRSFSFELSPSYVHAPFAVLTLQPQHGAPIILHSLQSPSLVM